ncbi:uncharacterized protein LOC119093720 isoform X2 [Pollicipes pollicipes]|uniref:uncharacterized protein LOC119093720 isoform X2 n=1 Tax=Pollicipes pollicipes TaxID=41117 RepID=UPI001884A5C4|nr:uncharacterized protein LOC119093720 isoform X2 [Pollicipes pollicipes]
MVHHMLCALDVDVNDCWASPHSSCRVTRFKLDSAIVETSYEMKTYERNVQLSELPATVAPLVAELLQRSTPPGVWVRLHPHESQHDDLRYVPDLQLKELKQQLSEVGQDPDKRKRKVAPNPAGTAS